MPRRRRTARGAPVEDGGGAILLLALRACTEGGARTMALDGYGVEPGCRADLVLVRGETLAEALVDRAPRPLVVKSGRVVARHGRALIEAP